MPDSSFEAQQKQLVGPREDPWQSSEKPLKAAGRVLRVSRVLKLLRSAENVPDSRPSKAAAKVLRVLRVLRGAENVLDSSFRSPIETACGTSEVPDSSFEAQQKQPVGPREDPWQSSERPSKAAARVLRVLNVLRGAENVPDSSFEAQ